MPYYLPRVPVFPIAGENSLITTGGAALRIPAKEKPHKFIGKFAPEIRLNDHLGRPVSLHATIALGRPIVLFFFPLAGSPHCTKESCSFRDALGNSPIFNELNAVVIGISQDDVSRQKRFVDEHQLSFRILHDEDRRVMDEWDVGRTMLGLVDARCTFIIDHEGFVRAMAEGVWDYQGHYAFAEKWLIRIEHELAGRERFYFEHHDNELVAGPEDGSNVRVMYGASTSATGKGIGLAPRYGAAAAAISERPEEDEKKAVKLLRPKSKRNLKGFFSPKTRDVESFDEPLYVESRKIKPAHHSLDDLPLNGPYDNPRATRSQSGKFKHSARHLQRENVPPLPNGHIHNRPDTPDSDHSSLQRFPHVRRIQEGWGASSTESNGSNSTARTSVGSSVNSHSYSHPHAYTHTPQSSSMQYSTSDHTFTGNIGTGDSIFIRRDIGKGKPAPGKRSSSLSLASKFDLNEYLLSPTRPSQGPEDVPQDAKDSAEAEEAQDSLPAVPEPAVSEVTQMSRVLSDSGHRRSIPAQSATERSLNEGSRSRTADSILVRGLLHDERRLGTRSYAPPSDEQRYTTPLVPRPSSRSANVSSVDTVMPTRQNALGRTFRRDVLRDSLDQENSSREGATTPTSASQAGSRDPVSPASSGRVDAPSTGAGGQGTYGRASGKVVPPLRLSSRSSSASSTSTVDQSSPIPSSGSFPRRASYHSRSLPLRSPVPSYAPPPLPNTPPTSSEAHMTSPTQRNSAHFDPSYPGSAFGGGSSSRSSSESDRAASIADSFGTFGGSPPDDQEESPVMEMNAFSLEDNDVTMPAQLQ